jgi:hypothetical protein
MAFPVLPVAGALILGYFGKKVFFPDKPVDPRLLLGLPPDVDTATGPDPQAPLSPPTVPATASAKKVADASTALYQYLKLAGFDETNGLATLIKTFQKSAGSDKDTVKVIGPVPMTGFFDAKTSAALTYFTKDPIPAHKDAPAPVHSNSPADVNNPTIPGHASLAGFNLFSYLLLNGDDRSAPEATLVATFQQQVNLDPKFLGPANRTTSKTLIPKSRVTGIYDDWTADALKLVVGVRIPPLSSVSAVRQIQASRILR